MEHLVLEPYQLYNLLSEECMANFIYPLLPDKAKPLADEFLLHAPKRIRPSDPDYTISRTKTLQIFELILSGKNTITDIRAAGIKRPTLRLNVVRGYLIHDGRKRGDNKYYLTNEGMTEYQRLSEKCNTKG